LEPATSTHSGQRASSTAAFCDGLLSDLGNPKMAVFFASVLPQFAMPGQGMLSSLMLLGLVFSTMTLIWLALYALAVASAGKAYRGSRIGRAAEAAMGAALIALGMRIATESR
jgi:threonine/homoserine/homoserine lactone efflux protein